VAVYADSVFEGIHSQITATAGRVTAAAAVETAVAVGSQLQLYPQDVADVLTALDVTDAEAWPQVRWLEQHDALELADEYEPELLRRDWEQFGSQLLDSNASGMEKAMAEVEAGRLLDINAELIIDTWDPYATFLRNLPFLAWARDVDLWEAEWSEDTKRAWVAAQFQFKSVRGSIGGIEMALDYMGRDFTPAGYQLRQHLTPPQYFFVAPDLTTEEYNAWISLMPEVRIYVGNDPGTADADLFVDDGFADDDQPTEIAVDNGWELYGRKAILRQQGRPDQSLRVIQRTETTTSFQTVDWEDIRVTGVSTQGIFADDDVDDDDLMIGLAVDEGFVDVAEENARTYSVRLDRDNWRVDTEITLQMIQPDQLGLVPLTVGYRRNSDVGTVGADLYFDDGAVGVDFIGPDLARVMLADYVYLLDPTVTTPMTETLSFFDVDRISFPKYTMELLIDLDTHEQGGEVWADEYSWWDETFFWQETNLDDFDRACRAVVAAKSLRDKALVAFDPVRPIIPSDPVTEETTPSDWVPNNL
jgi:phage tail P2-like protein